MYFCYFRFSIIVAFTTWYLVQCASLFQGFRRPSSAASWNMGSEIEEPPRSAPQDGDNHFGWKQTAEDRALWRATIKAAAETFVEERKLVAKETKRQRRKQSTSQPETPDQVFIWPCCTRTCRSRVGLHIHHRVCDRNNRTPFQWSSDTKNHHDTTQYSNNFPLMSWLTASYYFFLEPPAPGT